MIGLFFDLLLVLLIVFFIVKKKHYIALIPIALLTCSLYAGYIINLNPHYFYVMNESNFFETIVEDGDVSNDDTSKIVLENGLKLNLDSGFVTYTKDVQYYTDDTLAYVNEIKYVLERKYLSYFVPISREKIGYVVEFLYPNRLI